MFELAFSNNTPSPLDSVQFQFLNLITTSIMSNPTKGSVDILRQLMAIPVIVFNNAGFNLMRVQGTTGELTVPTYRVNT